MQGYKELMRKVKPKAVICYGEPFEEMQGKIITVDYAQTNNMKSNNINDEIYIKKMVGYVVPHNDKGMGSAGVSNKPTWTPKKSADERFIGEPGEIKETIQRSGERYLTKIGKNGYAEKERHCGNHGYPDKHSSPHDHTLDWSNNRPDPGPPINYTDTIPEFKQYGDDKMSNATFIDPSPFESIEDFEYSLVYGREIEFTWKGKSYGVFKENDSGEKMFFICEAYKAKDGSYFSTIGELLSFKIQGEPLKEIITKVQVEFRFL